MAASSVGRPKWRSYAVWEGERIIATGSLYVNRDYADMFGAATVPDARGRGAQFALLAARAREAKTAGCQWLVAETGAEKPGTHNTSLHNMLRAGLRPLYERVSWTWRRDYDKDYLHRIAIDFIRQGQPGNAPVDDSA
jgi:GNAT superfamily N-acetyltransferase